MRRCIEAEHVASHIPQRRDQPVPIGGQALIVELLAAERHQLRRNRRHLPGRDGARSCQRIEIDADCEQDVAACGQLAQCLALDADEGSGVQVGIAEF